MDKLIRKGTSPATAVASRANGRKSKGPVTEHGKAIACANAGKHWGRAETIRELMPALGESPAEFDQVREGLYQALRPRDAFEALLVDDMAELHWRLRRMIRGEVADQARGRREQMRRVDELEARFESGKFHDVERSTIPTLGFVGLQDTPVKFCHVLDILKTIGEAVRQCGFPGEVAVYLQQLYGQNPSDRAVKVMDTYDRCLQERESADEARTAANQAAFQEVLADEIAWFEKRAANHLQYRRELRAPMIESGLLSVRSDLGKVMLYQDRLERAFDRKWKLLMSYRMMQSSGEEADAGKTLDYVNRPQFHQILQRVCSQSSLTYDAAIIDRLVDMLTEMNQPLRPCYPRDFVDQICWAARYEGTQPQLRADTLAHACRNYFLASHRGAA